MKLPINMSLPNRVLNGALVIGVAMIACSLRAQDSATKPTTQGAGAKKIAVGDAASFIKEAAQGNQAEIRLAELAESKAQNADVKEFAKQLRKDHTDANQKLETVAQAHGVTISQSLDAKEQKKLDRFEQLSGSEFDKEYVKDMLRDHVKDIAKFEQAANHSHAEDVKQYAQNTLPTLRQHLHHARQAASAAGIDQATVSSILKESSPGMGGTAEDTQTETGSAHRHDGGDQK